MTTFIRAPEAARRLGVSTSTLYAYVSRGRVGRITAADGRASLFDVEEIDALRERNRRGPVEPPPSIDVHISSSVTRLDEEGLSYRDHRVESLVDRPYEDVAELLWSGSLPDDDPHWPTFDVRPVDDAPSIFALITLAAEMGRAAETSGQDGDASIEPADVARRFLSAIPTRFGVLDREGSFAQRLSRIWMAEPDADFVRVVNAALVLLADHELATSTLAVRVAASVRSSPLAALTAGLATVEGAFHGSASRHVHELLVDVERDGASDVLAARRRERRQVAGFGHSVYRRVDPRFQPLLERVMQIPDPLGRRAVVVDLVRTAGSAIAHQPNIDLALGAFTYIADLPADSPLFAIARIAGWMAHYEEELGERRLRFRGLARSAVN